MDILCKYLSLLTSIRVCNCNGLHSLTDLMEMIHIFQCECEPCEADVLENIGHVAL